MKKYAVIVAGGKGSRMGTPIAKQYLELDGLPILMHTLNKFHTYDPSISLILVIPSTDFDFWEELCGNYNFKQPHKVVDGGQTRFQSVKNGLQYVEENSLVAIHDGVRPLVDAVTIGSSFEIAKDKGNAVVAMPLKDSIREVNNGLSKAKDRSKYQIVQTPQTFKSELIKSAFETEELDAFTDDATVLEHAGYRINLVEGNYKNIKITTSEDLIVAEALLKNFSN